MSAIPCSSVSLKTMADGTLRISFDIEPKDAQDAFRLFAAPGTPAAIAALQVGYESVQDAKPETVTQEIRATEKIKIGPIGFWLVLRCGEPEFWMWLRSIGYQCDSMEAAASHVKSMLGVKSRKDIDASGISSQKYHRIIRGPYSKWLAARGVTV